MQPLCILRSLYYSIKSMSLVSGCSYKTDEEPTPENIHVLKCEVCGDKSISWSWDSLEEYK